LKFNEFERIAQEAFEAVPERFREGVDGLVVSRESLPHPRLRDVYTLGHCETESYPSEWVGPETTRSVVILYYGSFRNLARLDPEFDWDAEIHETVQHEVRHHLESLADEDELGGVDYAMDEDMKREEGQDFDPWYYQHGEPAGGGVYVVEDRVFIEQEWAAADFDATEEIRFRWQGRAYAIPRPHDLGDLHFVSLDGVESSPPVIELVLVRRRSWWEDVKRLVGSSRPTVLESQALAAHADGGSPP
jgi:predicted Zn-dependent protease with MMP-like domain